jgi:hypothetical protein
MPAMTEVLYDHLLHEQMDTLRDGSFLPERFRSVYFIPNLVFHCTTGVTVPEDWAPPNDTRILEIGPANIHMTTVSWTLN